MGPRVDKEHTKREVCLVLLFYYSGYKTASMSGMVRGEWCPNCNLGLFLACDFFYELINKSIDVLHGLVLIGWQEDIVVLEKIERSKVVMDYSDELLKS